METTDIINILTHEYVLVLYGVIFWEIALGNKGKRIRNGIRGMGLGGVVIAFDDELLARYNHFALIDFASFPWYLYVVAGFFADLVLTKFIFKDKDNG